MNTDNRLRTRRIVFSALVGALYATITVLIVPPELSFYPIQFRFAEALCLLPFFAPETILGLFVGCLISNLFSPFGPLDIIVGSLATLLSVFLVSKIKIRWLTPVPVVLCNALMVGAVLAYMENIPFFITALQVGLGELAVCVLLGLPLLYSLSRVPYFRQLFPEKFSGVHMGGETV